MPTLGDMFKKKRKGRTTSGGRASFRGVPDALRPRGNTRAYWRERRRELKRQGMCIDCAKRPVAARHSRCEPCLRKRGEKV